MFLCDECHYGPYDECLGLKSMGPCEGCHKSGRTKDCHCNRTVIPHGGQQRQMDEMAEDLKALREELS